VPNKLEKRNHNQKFGSIQQDLEVNFSVCTYYTKINGSDNITVGVTPG